MEDDGGAMMDGSVSSEPDAVVPLHDAGAHACGGPGEPCTAVPDLPGVCNAAGVCVLPGCGNTVVERSAGSGLEYCDDGNTFDNDGCDTDCTRACGAGAPACGDGNPCNGDERCGTAMRCEVVGGTLANGTPCTSPTASGFCLEGRCVAR